MMHSYLMHYFYKNVIFWVQARNFLKNPKSNLEKICKNSFNNKAKENLKDATLLACHTTQDEFQYYLTIKIVYQINLNCNSSLDICKAIYISYLQTKLINFVFSYQAHVIV